MAFRFTPLALPEVILIEPDAFSDGRGVFVETYKHSAFSAAGIDGALLQDNFARSTKKGVLRGLHYQQPPKAQGKLIIITRGSVFDVAVDIRVGSPRYGQWVGAELSGENRHMLWVPAGFAHGYLTLSDETEMYYKCTNEYAPETECGIVWNDPAINISWPLDGVVPIQAAKDAEAPLLKDVHNAFTYQGRENS